MAVGFGFSVSDICNGLKLIRDSVSALDEKHGVTSEYEALLREIQSLQDGLYAIDEILENEELQSNQRAALERAVNACRTSIEDFLGAISKYQPHIANVKSLGITPKFRKIKWALCKGDDVKHFRSQLERHASSINMLLVTLQTKRNLTSQATVSQTTIDANGQLTALMRNMTLEQRQCFLFITEQNRELLRTVQDLRTMLDMQRSLPTQVLLQQPVVLIDPFGKIAPFHLEFVDSADCLFAVLHARFAQAGVNPGGLAKLDNREFSLEDVHRKRQIDLQKPWPRVFRPGQQVDMRMIYHRFACAPDTCPSCFKINDEEEEAQWYVPYPSLAPDRTFKM